MWIKKFRFMDVPYTSTLTRMNVRKKLSYAKEKTQNS